MSNIEGSLRGIEIGVDLRTRDEYMADHGWAKIAEVTEAYYVSEILLAGDTWEEAKVSFAALEAEVQTNLLINFGIVFLKTFDGAILAVDVRRDETVKSVADRYRQRGYEDEHCYSFS